MILVDIGSSTTKIYKWSKGKLEHLTSESLHLKDGFDPAKGLKPEKELALFQIINDLTNSNPEEDFKIFGTAVFRQMENTVRQNFLSEFNDMTGFDLQVISIEDENSYMLAGLIDKCDLEEPVLTLTIGGGSTEISIVQGGDVLESYNIEIGVGTLLGELKNINESPSGVPLSEVTKYVQKFLPENNSFATVGFYTGGELTYMKLAGYELTENEFFKDTDHPSMITFNNFKLGNDIAFQTLSIDDLKSLMPNNPNWMLGARACSALAQAIFDHFKVKFIIPSDSNLMNGIVRKDLE